MRIDHARGQPERGIDLAHPFRVALGEVVVHRDDMHALARQRVQIGREGRDQRLALARLHLGDVALVQEDPAHQLHVEGAQAQARAWPPRGSWRRLRAEGRQGFRRFAQPLLELCRLGNDPFVRQRGELRLQRVDLRDQRPDRLDLAVVRRAEHLPRERSETQHVFSAWSFLTRSCEAQDLPASTAFHRRAKKARGALSHATPAM